MKTYDSDDLIAHIDAAHDAIITLGAHYQRLGGDWRALPEPVPTMIDAACATEYRNAGCPWGKPEEEDHIVYCFEQALRE